jgi:hypothetical protein
VCGDRHLQCEDHLGCDDRPPLRWPAPTRASLVLPPTTWAAPVWHPRNPIARKRADSTQGCAAAAGPAFASVLLLVMAGCAVPRSRAIADPAAAPPVQSGLLGPGGFTAR